MFAYVHECLLLHVEVCWSMFLTGGAGKHVGCEMKLPRGYLQDPITPLEAECAERRGADQ